MHQVLIHLENKGIYELKVVNNLKKIKNKIFVLIGKGRVETGDSGDPSVFKNKSSDAFKSFVEIVGNIVNKGG